MIRLAGLKQQVAAGVQEPGPDGMTPAEQLAAVRRVASEIKHDARRVWRDRLAPALAAEGIRVVEYDALPIEARDRASKATSRPPSSRADPAGGRPVPAVPHISNLSLNLAVVIRDPAGREHFARVKVPGRFRSSCRCPRRRGPATLVRSVGAARRREPRRPLPRGADRRGPPVPGDAQRRSRDPGAGGGRPSGDDRGERAGSGSSASSRA